MDGVREDLIVLLAGIDSVAMLELGGGSPLNPIGRYSTALGDLFLIDPDGCVLCWTWATANSDWWR